MAKKKNDKKIIEKNKSDVANVGNELKKVSWPKATASVIFLVVIVALIIFLSDSLFSLGLKKITEPIIEKQKKEQHIGTESTTSTTETKSEKTEENKTEENKKEETKTEENKENKEQQ